MKSGLDTTGAYSKSVRVNRTSSSRSQLAVTTPLVPAAIAFMLGIAASEAAGAAPLLAATAFHSTLALLAGCLLLILLRTGDDRSLLPALSCFLLATIAAGFARHQAAIATPPNHIAHVLSNERILTRVAGLVIAAPQSQPPQRRNPFIQQPPTPRVHFVLRTTELRTTAKATPLVGDVRVVVDAASLPVQLGDLVEVTGWLYRPRGPQNPGETDWASIQRYQGITAGLSVSDAGLVRIERSAGAEYDRFRAWLRAYAASLLLDPQVRVGEDEAGRAIEAMVLGQRSAVSRQVDEAFVRTGTVHILSVSGSHVGAIGVAVWFTLRRLLRRGRRTTAWITAVTVVLYAALAEPNAPIWRATSMGVFACAAVWLGRPLASLNWLACSALTVLAIQPLDLFRAGFQLSFLQVAVIVVFVPHVYRRVIYGAAPPAIGDASPDADTSARLVGRWAYRFVVALAVTSAAAWTAAAPLTLYHFGFFTPLGVAQSILLTPLFGIVIVFGFIGLVVGAVIPPLSGVMSAMLAWAMAWLLSAVKLLAAWPGSYVEVASPPAWLVGLSYVCAALGAALWVGHRRRVMNAGKLATERREMPTMPAFGMVRYSLALSAVCVPALSWVGWRYALTRPAEDYALHILAIGSGSTAFLAAPSGEAIVFDVGTLHDFDAGDTLRRALRAMHVRRLAAVTISHDNFDHYSGLPTLIEQGDATAALISPYFLERSDSTRSMQTLLGLCGGSARFSSVSADDELVLRGAHCDLLWPPADLPPGLDANDQSLVFRVVIGRAAVLVAGDIAAAAMDRLLRAASGGAIDLRADVLIAPHHGSIVWNTDSFLAAVRPGAIIVSTGRTREKYRELVRNSLGSGVAVYSTRDVGAVEVRFRKDGGVEIKTPFAQTGGGERGDGSH